MLQTVYDSLDTPGTDVGHPPPPGPMAALTPSGQQPNSESIQSSGSVVGVCSTAVWLSTEILEIRIFCY